MSRSDTYDFESIEKKWQGRWKEANLDAAPKVPGRQSYYCLVMFPYPSGQIHMGHVRNYVIGDVMARYHRSQGSEVLHPIGWDAFGLPAENAAIKHGIDPEKWTRDNIAAMRFELSRLALSYDWSREFATCDIDYYRWNQWFFIKMFEKGLAFRKAASVNWCSKCGTVLANEQVHEGKCWRCHTSVKIKELEQWFFKITAYAKALLDDMAELEKGWPSEVLSMQRHWIGQSVGADVDFQTSAGLVKVFTTRPDTLFGATFLALAPEHPFVPQLTMAEQKKDIEKYRKQTQNLSSEVRQSEEREKTGVFTGSYAVNPVNDDKIPIWVTDYVLSGYGTGAIMAVPAHDQRDFEFAQKFSLPITEVIRGKESQFPKEAYTGDGVLVNSGDFDGIGVAESKKKITQKLSEKGLGKEAVHYRLRDWLVSRQRYWGTPIPMIHCEQCGVVPVPEKELPVRLPSNVKIRGEGESPLKYVESFVQCLCPLCGRGARRETDTMDTFVDSSWYFAKYLDKQNKEVPFDSEIANAWFPVNQYIGGIEHACMHLIYARFFHKVMRDLGLVKSNEPFKNLLTQGMVTLGGVAMSKSRGNVVEPSEVVNKYGADTCRLFILFAAPPRMRLEWSPDGVEGMWRFLNRVWRLVKRISETKPGSEDKEQVSSLTRLTHKTIRRVTQDIEKDFGFNTALAALMEFQNELQNYRFLGDLTSRESAKILVQLLFPFAPHLTEELWTVLGEKNLLAKQRWPSWNESLLAQEEKEIVVQVNGRVRDRLRVPPGCPQSIVESKAMILPRIQSIIKSNGKGRFKKVIFVPDRLINFVV